MRATPRMKVMFMKQLPTMLPKARLKCPFLAELILVVSSGIPVPKATIVAPIITGGTPALAAMYDAESTMKKALVTTATAPINVSER